MARQFLRVAIRPACPKQATPVAVRPVNEVDEAVRQTAPKGAAVTPCSVPSVPLVQRASAAAVVT